MLSSSVDIRDATSKGRSVMLTYFDYNWCCFPLSVLKFERHRHRRAAEYVIDSAAQTLGNQRARRADDRRPGHHYQRHRPDGRAGRVELEHR